MEENIRLLIKLAAAKFKLLLDVARPSSGYPCNCFSGQSLKEEKGKINQFMGTCHPLVKFSSHMGANSIALSESYGILNFCINIGTLWQKVPSQGIEHITIRVSLGEFY